MGNRAMTTTYTYDALNRIISAHEVAVSLDTTRTYQYDTLGNLIRQEQDGCEEYKYNGFSLDESKECGVLPGIIGTCRWEYTYDGRGNLISEDKYTRTTTGMDWENVATYKYDETNHMVEGKNEQGEYSIYTYNGLGVRVARELIMVDNTHGYTDFHSETPSVESGLTRPEVVKESYVIDYTSLTFDPLTMDEAGGFNYRYVYGLDKLSVKITSEGTNWWGQNTTTNILKDYYHQDRMGSTTNMTDVYGRVVGRADYNEWGQITYKEALSITSSYRRIYPQLNYTGHDWDDVLGMYYAKARFYSADDKRFVAMDPVKGNITEPLSLVSYLYCVDNPLRWVDPLGLKPLDSNASLIALDGNGGGSKDTTKPVKGLPNKSSEIVPTYFGEENSTTSITPSTTPPTPEPVKVDFKKKVIQLLLEMAIVTDASMNLAEDFLGYPGQFEQLGQLGQHYVNIKNDFYFATSAGLFEETFYLLGFKQDWDGSDIIYHARQDALQQYGGFNDFYDFVFNAVTDMRRAKFDFSLDGNDYIFWAWKGDYLNLGAGAELGIYTRLWNTPHWIVDQSLALPMTLTLEYKGKEIIHYAPDEDVWWLTGFRPSYQKVLACDLVAKYTIDFSREDFSKKMYIALRDKIDVMGDRGELGWAFDDERFVATYIFK